MSKRSTINPSFFSSQPFLFTNSKMTAFKPAIFVCDIQTAFRKAIFSYPDVIASSRRVLSAAKTLGLPVYVTTQNRAKLGQTVDELDVSGAVVDADKTKFSMYVPEIRAKLPAGTPVAVVGIESHVCVLQTTIDLLKNGHPVYILADAVSSCNAQEKPIALRRMANLGAHITTTESFIYEVVGDASLPEFKEIVKLVKEEKQNTATGLANLASNL